MKCPHCGYIGKPQNCSCMWTLAKVATGQGTDAKVIANAKQILAIGGVHLPEDES